MADSTSYCYSNVLIYIDPFIDATNKYNFDLEIIANVPNNEQWGFSHLVFNTFDTENICTKGINPVISLTTDYIDDSNIVYKYYGLKNVPSLYYGYVLFDISFDYRFHDISALISLATDNSNDGKHKHWVINFDNKKSGLWVRCGYGQIPSDGVLTLNKLLAKRIIDTVIINEDDETMIETVYTAMYIQWNADDNYLRVGFGHILGENIIASIEYGKFNFDSSNVIKYIGFARSLGNEIPSVKWNIYTDNLPSFCFLSVVKEEATETHNYKQKCIENEDRSTNLIISDLVTPDCYYNNDLSNPLEFTFIVTEPHDYVRINIQLFAQFTYSAISSYIQVNIDGNNAENTISSFELILNDKDGQMTQIILQRESFPPPNMDDFELVLTYQNPKEIDTVDVGRDIFNSKFWSALVPILYRYCPGCTQDWKHIYYKR
eukprot:439866_1